MCYFYILFVYFFFFQAEDGIRDSSVTGVQTCALPIFPEPSSSVAATLVRRRLGDSRELRHPFAHHASSDHQASGDLRAGRSRDGPRDGSGAAVFAPNTGALHRHNLDWGPLITIGSTSLFPTNPSPFRTHPPLTHT